MKTSSMEYKYINTIAHRNKLKFFQELERWTVLGRYTND